MREIGSSHPYIVTSLQVAGADGWPYTDNKGESAMFHHGYASESIPGARTRAALALSAFYPGYFALVMATGIVSLAAHNHGFETVAQALFWINLFAYFALWVLTLSRLLFFPAQWLSDLTHHSRSAAFLTKIAATCILGCQFALLTPWMPVAKGLWLFGIALWLALSYTFLTVITVRNPKPPLEAGISGSWLLVIVGTESVSVLGTLIAPATALTVPVLFVSLAAYLVGAMLYVFFVTLVLHRWLFYRMRPEKLTPDYWIDMGAMAITTLAGADLLLASNRWELLHNLSPFLAGFTLLFWATGTWWIPLLLITELWRHVWGHVRVVYSPDYWSLVFPLGMYSAATAELARAAGLSFLNPVAIAFAYIALIAWAITFVGMIVALLQSSLKHEPSQPSTAKGPA